VPAGWIVSWILIVWASRLPRRSRWEGGDLSVDIAVKAGIYLLEIVVMAARVKSAMYYRFGVFKVKTGDWR